MANDARALIIGVNYPTLMKRGLLVFFVIAGIVAFALHIRAATQETAASAGQFAKRVVTSGLANPFQMVWGPDDYLWVTERTAGRVTRVRPSDGSTMPAIAISDLLAGRPRRAARDGARPRAAEGHRQRLRLRRLHLRRRRGSGDGQRAGRRSCRFTYDPRAHALGSARDVLAGLPAGTDHQGGRLVIGPDRKLYFTIGDIGANQLANFCKPNRAQSVPTARAGAGARLVALRGKSAAAESGRIDSIGQPDDRRREKPHLLVRPSQSSGAGLRAGREAVRVRARAEHRRRGQPDSGGRELRLAARRRLSGRPVVRLRELVGVEEACRADR